MPLAALSTCNLGRLDYEEAWATQRELADKRLAGEVGDTLILCEHPPVYTLGTNATRDDVLDPGRAEVIQTDRGGEVTWHGPGQVVGYVIADLNARGRDLHAFLRDLEEIMIRTLADFGLAGSRVDGLTGVWVDGAKVGALGVRVRKWISTHGFALNVSCDLDYYRGIVPCGIHDRAVTNLERALGKTIGLEPVRASCAAHFEEIFRT